MVNIRLSPVLARGKSLWTRAVCPLAAVFNLSCFLVSHFEHMPHWRRLRLADYSEHDVIHKLLLLLHLFYGLFSSTTWVSRYQKGKPFWILPEQDMMGWQWHQLDHMQIICTLLQRDNHASTSSLNFLQARCPSYHSANSIKAVKATLHPYQKWNKNEHVMLNCQQIWNFKINLSCTKYYNNRATV